MTPLGGGPASLERVRELDVEMDFPAAGDTDVGHGKCGVGRESRYKCGRKTRILDGRCGNCGPEEVVITAASTLWALLLLLGLRGVSVPEDVSTADVTATTLVFPVRIWPVAEGEAGEVPV